MPFPISAPRHGIALCDAAGGELLWIECLDDLVPGPRLPLKRRWPSASSSPSSYRVLRISAPAEPSEWDVETNRGRTRFILNSEDDVHRLDHRLAIIKDAQGLRYLIPDLHKLDAASRRFLERFL